MGGQRHAPAALPPGRRPGTHRMEGWVGRRAGLVILAPTGIRYPDVQLVEFRYTSYIIPAPKHSDAGKLRYPATPFSRSNRMKQFLGKVSPLC